jgi:hypothetical protein
MRVFGFLLSLAALVNAKEVCTSTNDDVPSNQCVQFSVGSGTGCAWMCNYCASQLGTNNYYFTDGVCTYQEGQGCVGNPVAGKTYSCCASTF